MIGGERHLVHGAGGEAVLEFLRRGEHRKRKRICRVPFDPACSHLLFFTFFLLLPLLLFWEFPLSLLLFSFPVCFLFDFVESSTLEFILFIFQSEKKRFKQQIYRRRLDYSNLSKIFFLKQTPPFIKAETKD